MLVEASQQGDFGGGWNCHVVLHGVQGAQDEVKDADGVAEGLGQLLDDQRKAVWLVTYVVVNTGAHLRDTRRSMS